MDLLKEIMWIGFIGVVFIYGSLKLSLIAILSPRSRKDLLAMMFVSAAFFGLLLTIPILADNITLKGLLIEGPQPMMILFFFLMLIFIMGFYKSYRLRFKGQETVILEAHTKYLNFIFYDGGRYMPGKNRKVYVLTYHYIVDGKIYNSKKYVMGEKLSYLTTVLYDPANPKRNIPVPAKHVDTIKY